MTGLDALCVVEIAEACAVPQIGAAQALVLIGAPCVREMVQAYPGPRVVAAQA